MGRCSARQEQRRRPARPPTERTKSFPPRLAASQPRQLKLGPAGTRGFEKRGEAGKRHSVIGRPDDHNLPWRRQVGRSCIYSLCESTTTKDSRKVSTRKTLFFPYHNLNLSLSHGEVLATSKARKLYVLGTQVRCELRMPRGLDYSWYCFKFTSVMMG